MAGTAEEDLWALAPQLPWSALGAVLALLGAVLLAFGAQLQHRGVEKVRSGAGVDRRGDMRTAHIVSLLRTPVWLGGIVTTALSMVLNLASLRFAPLIVVQPLGVVTLVVSVLLNARVGSYALGRRQILAMLLSVGGVAVFVTVAAVTARDRGASDVDMNEIRNALGVTLLPLAFLLIFLRRRFPALVNVLVAGALAGFVVTLAKALMARLAIGELDWETAMGVLLLLVVGAAALYFVQSAYASGPADLIVAGLVIVDPLVAVGLGAILLEETAQTPIWAVPTYLVSAIAASAGVFILARNHPKGRRTPLATTGASP